MKPLSKIVFGFSDAENYRRRENKDLFNQIFLRTAELEQLGERNIFFLVGEKGTGKTAYAVYMSNSPYKDQLAIHKYVRQTDYQKFMSLKHSRHLDLSDYADIWKVILYLLLSDHIYQSAGTGDFFRRFLRFSALKAAVDEYYNNAFSPEIPAALQFIEDSTRAATLIAKHSVAEADLKLSTHNTKKTTEHRFQTNLLYLQRQFEAALSSLRLTHSHILFIDGIDIRPDGIPYSAYLECVQGLANAVWSVNNDFFPTIRDSPGRLRVVLLVRPDIFNSLGLQNRNTKLKDNSVILDWRTTYASHRGSPLFLTADRLFAAQQNEPVVAGVSWDHYFPFDAATVYSDQARWSSFIVFLRYSFYRPRDILTILDILQRLYVVSSAPERVFRYGDLFAPEFRRQYGDYLLGEVKDSLSFYYDEKEFEHFLKFFSFLNGKKKFTYDDYCAAYDEFTASMGRQHTPLPDFMRSNEEFLQFLYDLNIICFFEAPEAIDGGRLSEPTPQEFIRWCFLERSPTNISPKIKTGLEYEIHYGLANTLNTGTTLRRPRPRINHSDRRTAIVTKSAAHYGTVKSYSAEKGFGFIEEPGLPIDIFIGKHVLPHDIGDLRRGDLLQYELEKSRDGRLIAKNVSRFNKE
jgi:cold shock CspA family protein